MAPPVKPEAQRKRPYAVSLTQAQQAKFQTLGGSRWLQMILDSATITKLPRESGATPALIVDPRLLKLVRDMTAPGADRPRSKR